jgi:hypothetical protein
MEAYDGQDEQRVGTDADCRIHPGAEALGACSSTSTLPLSARRSHDLAGGIAGARACFRTQPATPPQS